LRRSWLALPSPLASILALFKGRHKCPTLNLYIVHRQARKVSLIAREGTITVRLVEAITTLLSALVAIDLRQARSGNQHVILQICGILRQ
jgi:hypothetical protein